LKRDLTQRRAELAIGAAGALVGAVFTAAQDFGPGVVALMAVAGASLGAGRAYPRAAWIVAAVAMAAAGVAAQNFPDSGLLLLPVATFSAARWNGRWEGVLALVALVGATELGVLLAEGPGVPEILVATAGWGAGLALRQRELVAAELAERLRELDEERDAHAALSVRYERARIASELHDIVAHAISVMVVQATAGQRLAAHDPELTAEAFEAIAGAAREAEQDMGRLVALLSDPDAIGRAPDLALVEELVARAAGSGLDVTLRLEGEREGLPAGVAQIAYRVVQEGLTNALRYASGAAVTVTVRGESGALAVEVQNGRPPGDASPSLAGAGTGNGLRGLHERVAACGGEVDAGPTAAGGWRLSARVPTRARGSVATA
jgi:signal transduction histidine kinase